MVARREAASEVVEAAKAVVVKASHRKAAEATAKAAVEIAKVGVARVANPLSGLIL